MRKCLYKTFQGLKGQLFVTQKGQRRLIADCDPSFEIWKHSYDVPILGSKASVKEYKVSIVFCNITELDFDDFRNVTSFELITEAYREDGTATVRLDIDNMQPTDIEILGDWVFELDIYQTKELLEKLEMRF